MRSIETKVYLYDELSERAKDRARNDAAIALGYSWGNDALESIKALAEHFGGRMVDWEIDWWGTSHSSAKFEMPDEMDAAEIRAELEKLGTYNAATLKGTGECKLTGYCADEDAIDGFRFAFLKDGVTDLGELMQAAFRSWLKSAQDDATAQYSDKVFADSCSANGYEFFEDGKLVRGNAALERAQEGK